MKQQLNKQIRWTTLAAIFIWTLCSGAVHADAFSTFAVQNTEYMEWIKGKWQYSDRDSLYEYTETYGKHIDGFPYYKFKISRFPGNSNYIYSIFKSKKTGKSYFCRGHYNHKTGFRHSVSRIQFEGPDQFIVYTEDNDQQIYFTATRIKAKPAPKKTNKNETQKEELSKLVSLLRRSVKNLFIK